MPYTPPAGTAGTGDASAANQLLGNVSLASIDAKTPASPATTGKQDTGNTSLASMDTKLTDRSQFTKLTDGTDTALVTAAGEQNVLESNSGAILTSVQLIDDPVATLGTTTYSEATTKGNIIGAVRRDANTTLVDTTNEVAPLQVNSTGELKVAQIQALPAGTNAIGKLAANDGVDIGDVTINNASINVTDNASSLSVDWNGTQPVTGSGTATGALRVELPTNGTGVVGLNAGTNNIGDVDVLTINGVAPVFNTGTRSATTLRVTQATDDVVHVDDNSGSLTVDQATGSNLHTVLDSGTLTSVTNTVITDDLAAAATGSAVPANAHYQGLNDGTNLRGALAASAANLTSTSTQAVQVVAAYATWSISHRPAAATKATATKAAGAAGVRHVVTAFSFTSSAGATAQTPLQIDIIDGASGGTTRLWSGTIAHPANGFSMAAMSNVSYIGTAATALTIEFSALGAANTIQAVTLWGYSTS